MSCFSFFSQLFFSLVWRVACSLALMLALLAPSWADELNLEARLAAVTNEQLVTLSRTNAWTQLGHYHDRFLGQRKSQVQDSRFFLAPQGQTQPQAELEATWQALQASLTSALDEEADLRCRFPARAHWLATALDIPLPARPCSAFDAWYEEIDPGRLTLVFPSAYLNNAASMFGHTLLRIDAANTQQRPDLVAFAVNYAAQVDSQDGGMAYAIKGMLGRYPGYFSLMPYYEKVNEYNQLESRDMWELPLDISAAGVEQVMRHLWELNEMRFTYWFFDQNCSYQLLAVLSVAQEDLDLTRGFQIKALPVDTLRALDQAGLLIEEAGFRPSFATRLHNMAQQMTADEVELARVLVFDQPHPRDFLLSEGVNQTAIYELAAEWISFRFQHQGLAREQAAPQMHRLLVARAQVRGRSGLTPPATPEVAPHQGHGTARWGVGLGWQADQAYLSLVARPAYHTRYDAVEGYLANAEINLFELELRFFEDEQRLEPWRLNLVEVGNYLPSSPIFSMAAWRVQTGLERTDPEVRTQDSWRGFAIGGYGRAWGEGQNWMTYGFVTGRTEIGPQAGHAPEGEDWALGAGINLGFVWAPVRPMRLGLDAHWQQFMAGHTGAFWSTEATVQWNFAQQQALRLQGEWDEREESRWQVGLTWLHYF